ncbi:RNA polymerase sigma factor [Cohnella faecalis]|uniref:RNA polymerase sigma factor n=1 Tax=Cohnella faecalis TaxID=2315694 RepID=A0A398CIT1_9BACL|nr:RNA polymerase sigma factor [Cohnella faecalis]RIE01109.1 RNA polymerase sigma factor [Cohnella faecalis]
MDTISIQFSGLSVVVSFQQRILDKTALVLITIHDHTLAEDIIQDAFIKAITNGPKIRPDSNIPAWVKQVTRNTALDRIRKLKRDRQALTEVFLNIGAALDDTSTASKVEIKWRDELLHKVMAELNPDSRALLLMFYIEGKSYREICQELHISESVLTQRLARARKKLLHRFLRKWGDHDE